MKSTQQRILSIDILRGLVMVIMALDHTRDFFLLGGMGSKPMDPDTTNIFLFFTRWITHFCAPTFVFLSGISAYLSAKNKDPKEVSYFLIKRGLWLVVVDIVFINLALTFNPLYNFVVLTVIWAIGCSMILLGILSRISHRLVLVVGLILFFGHNLLDYFGLPAPNTFTGGLVATLFARASVIQLNANHVVIFSYAILPWAGAMLIGFAIGKCYNADFEASKRRRYLFYGGLALFLSFILLRYFSWYGNPSPRKEYSSLLKTFFDFLDLSKYPPSLQFYGMTLGPVLMLLSGVEQVKNRFTKILMVYGNVPFFYYVSHLYLLHMMVVIVFFVSGFGVNEIITSNNPFLFVPPTFGFNLAGMYVVWLSLVALLYLPCRWFLKYKATHTQWWLKYV